MNKNIKINHFCLIDYNILLKVVAQYVKQHQLSRNKLEWEEDTFTLTNTVYYLETFKNPVKIEIENHWKDFWVSVKETRTQYTFNIRYAG